VTIIATDTKVRSIHEVNPSDSLLDLKLQGGGGTDFKDVFNYLEPANPTVLLFFTDMCFTKNFPTPDYPTIFINTWDNKPGPFGSTLYIKD